MSPRRTTLPELARFPPKVTHLRRSPRFGRTRVAGPEPPGRRPDPLPPARSQPQPVPSRQPSRPAAALRQSGLTGQPLPAAGRPMTPLDLPRAPPRQRAGPPEVPPPMMPAYWPRHPRLPGKIPLRPAHGRTLREPPRPSFPRSAWPPAARPPPWAGSQGRARSAGRSRRQAARRRARGAPTAAAVIRRPVACSAWSAVSAGQRAGLFSAGAPLASPTAGRGSGLPLAVTPREAACGD